jgi:transposase
MKILALDLGKNNTVACILDSLTSDHSYVTVVTTPCELHDLIVEHEPQRVVLEICPSAGWVCDLVQALGVEAQVANPTHEAWRWRNVKHKSDKQDALKLARLSAMNQLPTVYMPAGAVRQWRSFIHYRQRLIKRRVQIRNHIRAILTQQALQLPQGKAGWRESSIKQLKELSCALGETSVEELWRGQLYCELQALESINELVDQVEAKLNQVAQQDDRVRLLRTIPGVGPRLAETVVAVIDDPHRFRRGKHVASYVGLTPRRYQSGDMDRQGKISGQGHKMLRSLLVEVSWLGIRHNPWMRTVYERTLTSSSRKKIAIVAVARRLLIVCWAMLRDGRAWNQDSCLKLTRAA